MWACMTPPLSQSACAPAQHAHVPHAHVPHAHVPHAHVPHAHTPTRSLACSPAYPPAPPLARSLIPSSTHLSCPFSHLFSHSPAHSPILPLIRPFSRSFAHSPAHSSILPLICPLDRWRCNTQHRRWGHDTQQTTHGATQQRGATHSADSMLHGNAMVTGSSVLWHDMVAHMVQPNATQCDTACNMAHRSMTTMQYSASHSASQCDHDARWHVTAQPNTTQRHTACKTAHRSMTTTQRSTSHGPSQHDHDTSRCVTQCNPT